MAEETFEELLKKFAKEKESQVQGNISVVSPSQEIKSKYASISSLQPQEPISSQNSFPQSTVATSQPTQSSTSSQPDLAKLMQEINSIKQTVATPIKQEPLKDVSVTSFSTAQASKETHSSKDDSSVFNIDELVKQGKATLLTKYGDTEIYRIEGQATLFYRVPIPKPTPSQKLIINTLKEAATRLIAVDPYKIRDPIQRKNIYYQKIIDILESAPEINIPKHLFDFYADAVVKEMVGYGALEPLLNDDKLEDIMVVCAGKPVYVYHSDFGMMATNIVYFSDDEIYEIIDKIARSIGRRVDMASPLLDARLPDGSRVNATIPPASVDGSTITIRKFRQDPYSIIDLINLRTIDIDIAGFIWCAVEGFGGAKPANILISGGTSSGKTTFLNVCASFVPERERVLTIEDTAELRLPIKQVIRFEARPPGLEGKGELTMDILTKNALRMRPDRIIVGEVRHQEAFTLLTAMNTGHDGCMGTIHANTAPETIVRLTSPPMDVPQLMLAGLDLIFVMKKINTPKGLIRKITSISEVTGVIEGSPKIVELFAWNPRTDRIERTKAPMEFLEKVKAFSKLSDSELNELIIRRTNVLKNMVENNIRSLTDVSKIVQKEYLPK
jgi:flagellar protein FlaI